MKQEVWDSAVAELTKQVQLTKKKAQQKEKEENERKEKEIFETSVTIVSEVVKRIDETPLMAVILTLPRHSGATTYVIGNQIKKDNKEINSSQILELLDASGLTFTDMTGQTDLAIDVEEFFSFGVALKQNK